jgi:hypothetical protein
MQATHNVYIAGSSAAANGVVAFLEGTLCGNTAYSIFTTPTTSVGLPDFRAVSCTAAGGQPFAGSTVTVWYRPEGGSVVGVFPVLNNTSIKQLNMSAAGCTLTSATSAATAAYSCGGVVGTTPGNGTDDSFGTGTLSHTVDIGVSDMEPGAFASVSIGGTGAWAGAGNNDPVGTYSTAFTGSDRGVDAAQAMTHATIFQQVFGFGVSTNLGITDLPKDQIAGIFDGLIVDWKNVSKGGTNGAVTTASTPIVVCNREIGSGTRGSVDVFLNGDGCNGVGAVNALVDLAGSPNGTVTEPTDNFATNLEIDCINTHANAIGYVSIDNFSKFGTTTAPNVNSITVSGAAATQNNGATGVYGYVFEASLNENASASADGQTLYTNLVTVLQNGATTAKSGQILAIPGQPAANKAQIPLQVGNEPTSLFSRGGGAGNSCTPLVPAL